MKETKHWKTCDAMILMTSIMGANPCNCAALEVLKLECPRLASLFLQLRWIKLPAELKLMKEAASIACQALLLTMLHSKTYPFESMLAAKVEYECRMKGAQRMG
ncbi:hypothetical protein Ahy_A01g002328 [Arachis hypogaea]|uniref:Uncharacterized protein n=1 Tax=Arachis hypogaea TaxID=3818 RepID=A0A445EQI6_ARAHY|nr:hypothetical protein Ahy_A01g002328 [Arachis hypogaea]